MRRTWGRPARAGSVALGRGLLRPATTSRRRPGAGIGPIPEADLMAWVVRDGHVLASVEVAETFPTRLKGLLGRDGFEGALLLRPARAVHTIGMRFPVDVAFLDKELCVVRVTTMKPWRLGRPEPRAHAVLEAEAGAFTSWELHPGDVLELRE